MDIVLFIMGEIIKLIPYDSFQHFIELKKCPF